MTKSCFYGILVPAPARHVVFMAPIAFWLVAAIVSDHHKTKILQIIFDLSYVRLKIIGKCFATM